MAFRTEDILRLAKASLLYSLFATLSFTTTSNANLSSIQRDVVIIGGGSSGTYSAIRLKALNKTVAVIERQDVLGGHTQTYTTPSGDHIDYGVKLWENLPVVNNYFNYLNLPSTVLKLTGGLPTKYVDFKEGKVLNFTAPDPSAAVGEYYGLLLQYPYLEDSFDLPNPVPSDLTMRFGDFIQKYNIQNLGFFAYQYAHGLGNILDQTTIYVMKYISQTLIQDLQAGFIITQSGNNHQLYDLALQKLGSDAFLNSNVLTTFRQGSQVQVLVQTPKGLQTITAKTLIISIPPLLSNLIGFDLSPQELSLFAQFNYSAYYTSVLTNTGLPATFQTVSTSSYNNSNTPLNVPLLPGSSYGISPTAIPGYFTAELGSPYALPDQQVKDTIVSNIKRLQSLGLGNKSEPTFAAYSSHTPFTLTASPQAIKNGFYKQLTGLQGQRNTYYTGAAFATQASAALWNFTEGAIISKVVPGAPSWV